MADDEGRLTKLHVLGVTSWWLLVPCAACGRPDRALALLLALSASVSARTYPSLRSADRRWIRRDRATAVLLFAALARRTIALRAVTPPLAVALLFAASRAVERRAAPSQATACLAHLSFRFVGFWWAVWVARGGALPSRAAAAGASALYWAHALAECRRAVDAASFARRYAAGSAFVCALASSCAWRLPRPA